MSKYKESKIYVVVVVVYHVTIVAIGHKLLKKCWPFGNRLRSTHCREFNYLKLCRPAYFVITNTFNLFSFIVHKQPSLTNRLWKRIGGQSSLTGGQI